MQSAKFIVIAFFVSALIILIANLYGQSIAVVVGNLLYIPIAGSFVIVAIWVSLRFGFRGIHGKAWLLFAIFAILWFIAEMIWAYNDLILHIDPYPSIADAFWLAGYPVLFSFMMMYFKVVRKGVSKKTVTFVSIITLLFLGMIFALSQNTEGEDDFGLHVLTISYPILDVIILAPAIIGIVLFFKGEVNLLWTFISFGILLESVADLGFFVTQFNQTYYTGHPIEIFFYWGYIFYTFGAYSHLKIFRKSENKF